MEKIITLMEYPKRIEKRIPAYNLKNVCKNLNLSETTINKIINLENNKSYSLNVNNDECKIIFTKENDTYKIDLFQK